jgi:UDP-glucose 4-epimerase
MKILITGAGGFVGKRLVAQLAARGHDVLAVLRREPEATERTWFDHPRVHVLFLDLSRFNADTLPSDVDAIITLAQSSRFRDFPAQADEVFAVNVTANLQLLQWAVKSGVKRIVHASSGGIYGGRTGGRNQETDLLAVDSPLGFYLGSKLCSEVVLQNYRHFFETAVILRPFFIYGPGQRPDMFIARLVESVREGKPVSLQGEGGLRVNPVYVDDAVEAFAAALELKGVHVINVAGPDILTLRQICDRIGAILQVVPIYESRSGDPVDYVGDISQAREKLGMDAASFSDGIARMIAP